MPRSELQRADQSLGMYLQTSSHRQRIQQRSALRQDMLVWNELIHLWDYSHLLKS